MFYVKQKSSRVAPGTFILFLFSQFRFVISCKKNLIVEKQISFIPDEIFKFFQRHYRDFPLFYLIYEKFAFVVIVMIVDYKHGACVGVAGKRITFFNE